MLAQPPASPAAVLNAPMELDTDNISVLGKRSKDDTDGSGGTDKRAAPDQQPDLRTAAKKHSTPSADSAALHDASAAQTVHTSALSATVAGAPATAPVAQLQAHPGTDANATSTHQQVPPPPSAVSTASPDTITSSPSSPVESVHGPGSMPPHFAAPSDTIDLSQTQTPSSAIVAGAVPPAPNAAPAPGSIAFICSNGLAATTPVGQFTRALNVAASATSVAAALDAIASGTPAANAIVPMSAPPAKPLPPPPVPPSVPRPPGLPSAHVNLFGGAWPKAGLPPPPVPPDSTHGSCVSTLGLGIDLGNLGNLGEKWGDRGASTGTSDMGAPPLDDPREALIMETMMACECSREEAVMVIDGDDADELAPIVLVPVVKMAGADFATIFKETLIDTIELRLKAVVKAHLVSLLPAGTAPPEPDIRLAIFRQRDGDGRPHTVFSVESTDKVTLDYLASIRFEFDVFSFSGSTMAAWLDTVNSAELLGTTYSVKFGPFPFELTDARVDRYDASFFRIYGDVTHKIMYSDRTMIVGFALKGKPPPPRRNKIPLIFSGKCMGTLHPCFVVPPPQPPREPPPGVVSVAVANELRAKVEAREADAQMARAETEQAVRDLDAATRELAAAKKDAQAARAAAEQAERQRAHTNKITVAAWMRLAGVPI